MNNFLLQLQSIGITNVIFILLLAPSLLIPPYAIELAYALDNGSGTSSQEDYLKDSYQLTTFGSQPSWSADGKRILFVSHSTYPTKYLEIWVIGADGSNPTLIKQMPEHTSALYPKFSPDGKKIAFIGDYGCLNCHSRNFLSIMDSDGSYMREIADGGYRLGFTWTADNKIILARVNNHTDTSLFQIDPTQNSKAVFLTELPIDVGDLNITISKDGTKLLFTGFDYYYDSQIYSLDLANNNTKAMPIHGTDGLLLVSLSKDEQTIFATDVNPHNSYVLYAIDAKNVTNKTQLSYGSFGYSVYEKVRPDTTNEGDSVDILEPIVAYSYAPGGRSYTLDKDEWNEFGIYVGCKNNCESRPSEVFTGGFTVVNGEYVKNNISNLVMIASVIGVAITGGVVVLAKRRRDAN